ncbi:MAG: hypothetical protein ACK4PI_05005 [Tepidisphaerales bacterium]
MRNLALKGAVAAAAMLVGSAAAQAALVEIQISGVNLVYNGTSVVDAGGPTGNVLDPADADQLNTMTFINNGVPVGTLLGNIFLDLSVTGLGGILDTPGNIQTVTSNVPGYVDLLIGTSQPVPQYLQVNVATTSLTYVDVGGILQFAFVGSLGLVNGQALPFALTVADPVTVSFSLQIDPGTLTSSGGFITGFEASGTGEIRAIPEPAAMGLLVPGLLALRRRR